MRSPEIQPEGLSFEQAKIAKFLKKLRFKRKFLGVDEADVWKQIEQLNELYAQALQAERVRYDLLLEDMYGRPSGPGGQSREEAVYDETGIY